MGRINDAKKKMSLIYGIPFRGTKTESPHHSYANELIEVNQINFNSCIADADCELDSSEIFFHLKEALHYLNQEIYYRQKSLFKKYCL